MSNPVLKAREPWLAITLSLLCGGLGQIYCGAVRRGLLINGGCLLLGLATVGLAAIASSTLAVAVFAVVALGLVWLALWSVRDAGRLARRPEMREYALQEYNDPWVYTILILPTVPLAIALALFLRSNVVEAFVIPSDSMAPTIVAGDRILTNKLGVATRTLERGDLVVFRNPLDRRQRFIKRIVGLPGDTVALSRGTVIVNEQALTQTLIAPPEADRGVDVLEQQSDRQYAIRPDRDGEFANVPPVTVPPGAYYVLGDHRGNSQDSRTFGVVSHGEVVGVATYRYWPAKSWGRLGAVR